MVGIILAIVLSCGGYRLYVFLGFLERYDMSGTCLGSCHTSVYVCQGTSLNAACLLHAYPSLPEIGWSIYCLLSLQNAFPSDDALPRLSHLPNSVGFRDSGAHRARRGSRNQQRLDTARSNPTSCTNADTFISPPGSRALHGS